MPRLLSAGAAFAATTPTATPAATRDPGRRPRSTNSAAHCDKQAKEKKLTGDEKKKFVKDCKEGKKAN